MHCSYLVHGTVYHLCGTHWLVLLLCVVVLVCSALKIPKMYKFKEVTIVNFESFFSARCTVICRLFKKVIKNLKTFMGLCSLKLQLLGSRRLTRT